MSDAAIWSIVLTGLVACAVVGVSVVLVVDDRDPSIVLAWLLLILLVPVLGVLAYFLVGRDYRRATRRREGETSAHQRLTGAPGATPAAAGPAARVQRLGEAEGRTAPVSADSIRLYFTGAEKFEDLLADLRAAEHRVDLMYLIWECDELTARVTEVLRDRLAAGVRVRILYDWLSSAPYRKRELKALAGAGAVVRPCYRRLSQLNYRNHMKMVLVDDEVVYSGGMNMGQEYIDGGPRFATWRDTHFRMTGPVVAEYAELFDATWGRSGPADHNAEERPAPPVAAVPPPIASPVQVQVLHSSVATSSPTIRDAFIAALTSARDRVWIQSPYFVPDEPLINAMCVAAASGVEVRLMMTGHPDKKLPFHAAHAYFPTVLRAGVQVLLYDAGFLHAKTVTVDDELVIVGTCNWDIRSLLLHDEVVAVIYDQPTVKRFADQFETDLKHSRTVTLADTQGRSRWQTGRDSLCRLTSRLL